MVPTEYHITVKDIDCMCIVVFSDSRSCVYTEIVFSVHVWYLVHGSVSLLDQPGLSLLHGRVMCV